jgi:hypothetical protein
MPTGTIPTCSAKFSPPSYEEIGKKIGRLVESKNTAYGNSFGESFKILKVLYPNGVKPEQYRDMLATIRIIDKLFRIAYNKGYNGESPWSDIVGYGILGVVNDIKDKEEK